VEVELTMSPLRLRRLPSLARAQRGVTLVIALIVLVAMTLAGVAMMRSVDTGSIVAGNIAFRQSSVHAADQGLQSGYTYILANAGTTVLYNNANDATTASIGYFSSTADDEPDWMAAATWVNAGVLNNGNADAGGNVVYYKIERMCKNPNVAPDDSCGSTPDSTAISGEGVDQSAPNFFTLPPATHYRVTARAVGPRNSITVVQTLLRSQ
jgi:Tfp pilus assembly protein PilX